MEHFHCLPYHMNFIPWYNFEYCLKIKIKKHHDVIGFIDLQKRLNKGGQNMVLHICNLTSHVHINDLLVSVRKSIFSMKHTTSCAKHISKLQHPLNNVIIAP